MGAHSYREKLFAYPNTELGRFPAGPVGCVFQSGGSLQFWLRTGADRGLRFSYGITSGNEADLDLADYLNFLVDDPNTHQIAMFIEGIRRPQAFMRAAARALAAGKPMTAIKTGATAKSQAAAQSHTGAIGGDYAAYLAMCERYGICNCRSLDDMLETALAFDGGRLPKGPRIGFVTTSGGTVDLLYDYAESEHAAMPDFAEETHTALIPFVQEGIAPKNPLDLVDSLKAPVLGLYGGADQGIPNADVEKMQAALKAARKSSEIVLYDGAPHGFHADYRPSYRETPAKDGWQRLRAWFQQNGAA
jgi:acyl-CoA synthetase (NDP forming)